MTLPGYTAENSIYRTTTSYAMESSGAARSSRAPVQPASVSHIAMYLLREEAQLCTPCTGPVEMLSWGRFRYPLIVGTQDCREYGYRRVCSKGGESCRLERVFYRTWSRSCVTFLRPVLA